MQRRDFLSSLLFAARSPVQKESLRLLPATTISAKDVEKAVGLTFRNGSCIVLPKSFILEQR